METALLVLTVLTLIAAIVAAIAAFRAARPSQESELTQKLAESEARLREEIKGLSERLERSLREAQDAQSRATLDLSERLSETISKRFEGFGDRLTTLQGTISTSLNESRDKVIETATAARKEQAESQTEARRELATALAQQEEKQRLAAELLNKTLKELGEEVSNSLTVSRERLVTSQAEARKEQGEALGATRKELTETLRTLQESVLALLRKSAEEQALFFEKNRTAVAESLEKLRQDNEQRLEKIRETVDEKLQKTLNERLGESFRQVSERLEQVHKGLGEMQQLATGVGELKTVLTNVRSRGTYGEVQLRGLLEQVMTPSQYRENIATKPGSNDRVEFAIELPGKEEGGKSTLLPIDAKFPIEDYQRLLTAYDHGDSAGIDASRKALGARVLAEAKKIREKYVSPPETTDFALLFLPTEGLFAEVLRLEGVAERVQREHHTVLVGPTTLYAVLNSLQMGFRTLAIERQSSHVWEVLRAVKTEFSKFANALADAQKSLNTASDKLDKVAGTRTRAMERRLKKLESLPEEKVRELLPEVADDDDSEEPAE